MALGAWGLAYRMGFSRFCRCGRPAHFLPFARPRKGSKAAHFMQEHIRTLYILGGVLALLLVAQAFWGLFLAYPTVFERMLRRGRAWVYVPLRWQGFRKLQILFVSRLLVLAITVTGTYLASLLFIHPETRKHAPVWVAAVVAVLYFASSWLQGVWSMHRYRQQEDAYYLLHDELRAKFESENKDYNEAQIRSLSANQHKQGLLKADEEGKLLIVLQAEAHRFRKARTATPRPPEA